ncbi:LacI family transcriptional regulator [Halolactibacillus alkaliphilus]|uniref:Catabolite control protein A n=1 Tax=Halolactibacillus alkaliphilus TaxID=442899 RepID=A0A511X219_9BACI|nr:LacI family DNA-binding transcriptional regulator [Halolactibacillus alkaliphilus]GEN56992.1 LacI family transcriptional regulator [Halolactibacillus alkaliphilus]GGN71633.1 LacI family transcriptional regulator [Halolactibacillus alkaliphilus]SFO84917.1 transcriptional regulator, LacI family [Halolactibacillus alkaliphilus]
MVSIKDVAKHAGVSVTTVSRVMNNRGYIGEATRKKVEEAIKALNYSPNQIARSLLSNESHLIGLIVPEIRHPFFSEIVHWIEHYASQNNFKIIICNSVNDKEKESGYLQMLKEHRADGVIMCSHTLDIEVYKSLTMPIVTFDRIISSKIPYVASDNYHGGELATQHLIKRGCRKLLHIAGPLDFEMLSNRRFDAFQMTCSRNSIMWDVIEGANVDFTFEDNYRFIEDNLADIIRDFDGVFCSNDIMAYALSVYAFRHGITVPDDLKIIGYDYNSFIRTLQTPKLTTIKQPIEQLSKQLVKSLIKQMKHNDQPLTERAIFDVELIKGETT